MFTIPSNIFSNIRIVCFNVYFIAIFGIWPNGCYYPYLSRTFILFAFGNRVILLDLLLWSLHFIYYDNFFPAFCPLFISSLICESETDSLICFWCLSVIVFIYFYFWGDKIRKYNYHLERRWRLNASLMWRSW